MSDESTNGSIEPTDEPTDTAPDVSYHHDAVDEDHKTDIASDDHDDDFEGSTKPASEQPDPQAVAKTLDDPAQQRDPLLQIAKNQFIANQDYNAHTVVCPVCQAEFNPGAPVL